MATSSISNLDSYYQNLINYTLTQEKQPITRLTTQKDAITVKKAVYTDLKLKFDTLQTAINTLRSSQTTNAVTPGRSVNISPTTSGTTVATASVGYSVSAGTYALSVTNLARAHEVHSIRQSNTDQALGLASGTFVIGGAVERGYTNLDNPIPTTVSSVAAGSGNVIMAGQKELGTGSYSIQTRNDATVGWQFRIVNEDGVVQSIKESGSTDFTSSWQSIPTGETYDTGRGLSVTFGSNTEGSLFTAGTAKLDYAAKGTSISVTNTMSLVDINSAINSATYASGNEVVSSIIDNTLVLKNLSTGESHVMQATDTSGSVLQSLGVLNSSTPNDVNTKVTARNAEFSINNMAMERSSNTGLTDVVTGMTLNLVSDAEGKSANIVVTSDMTSARKAINTFISAFNDLNTYVRGKTTTVKNADETYSRGALVSEQNLRYTANDLIASINQDHANTGIFQNLSEIGITINSDLSVTVSDETKLNTALSTQLSDMTKILDAAMDSMATKVGTYAGTSGYINQSLTSANSQETTLTSRITSMNERITRRQESLVKQYAIIQAQMETLMNQSTLNSTLYG